MLSTTLRAAAGTALTVGLLTGFPSPAQSQAVAPPRTPAATAEAGECVFSPNTARGARNVGTPPVAPPYTGSVRSVLKTNLGDIRLDLDGAKAPCTIDSFTYLAQKNYFDKTG